ncbi:MAG: hypothetical protein RLZZ308_723 [Candidatus Parcubacteria bacterium]|jgi:predicted nuclease of predicted toxin-antitoxin system
MTTLGKIIVGVVVIGGAVLGGYFVTSYVKNDVTSMQTDVEVKDLSAQEVRDHAITTASTTDVVITEKDMSFADLLSKHALYTCTIQQTVLGVTTEGKVYVQKNMIRGEFTTKTQGMEIASSVLTRDGYTYTWSSMSPTTGSKVKTSSQSVVATGTQMSASYTWNSSQVGSYSCKEESVVDDVFFVVPNTITFTEISL